MDRGSRLGDVGDSISAGERSQVNPGFNEVVAAFANKVDGDQQRQGLKLLSNTSRMQDERVMAMKALTVLKYLSEEEKRRRKITAKGGIEATVKVMRDSHEYPHAQAAGLRVLVNMSQEKQEVRKMRAGVIEVALAAMKCHGRSWSVLEGTWVQLLWKISEQEEGLRDIRAAGGFEALAAVMQ